MMPFKTALKRVIVKSAALRLAGRWAPASVAVLIYHSVQDRPELTQNTIDMGYPTPLFDRQMRILADDYNVVTVDDLLSFLNGRGCLPRRSAVVTFDDGFADNAEVAAPLLERYGIRAAFYLTAGLIGTEKMPWYCRLRYAYRTTRRKEWPGLDGALQGFCNLQERERALQGAWDYCAALPEAACENTVAAVERQLEVDPPLGNTMMTWDQVRGLHRAGHIIGSHTLSHPNMAYVPAEEAWKEFVESKKKLEEQVNAPVRHFSYPHPALEGEWSEKTVELSAQAGYQTAMTTRLGPVLLRDNPLTLRRVKPADEEFRFRWNLDWALCGLSS